MVEWFIATMNKVKLGMVYYFYQHCNVTVKRYYVILCVCVCVGDLVRHFAPDISCF